MNWRDTAPKKIKPEIENPHWHEHRCFLYRLLSKKDFQELCPYKSIITDEPEYDTYCEHCPYFFLINYDKKTKLIQIWGDANVLHPDYDFTKNYI